MIAVYGTLRDGCPANTMLRHSEYIGTDAIPGKLYDLGAFPGLVETNGHEQVTVDIYRIPETLLPNLDCYEGYHPEYNPEGCLYLRKKVTTVLMGLSVWTYIYNQDYSEDSLIVSGDWVKYSRPVMNERISEC